VREVVTLADALGIDMPISREVNAVVHGGKPALDAVKALLSREQRPEDAC
jgi:glycerol-3-phosphate dehydrogenase (NAD(P)+)